MERIAEPETAYGESTVRQYEKYEIVRYRDTTDTWALRQIRVLDEPLDSEYVTVNHPTQKDRLDLLARVLDATQARIEDLPPEEPRHSGEDSEWREWSRNCCPVPASVCAGGKSVVAAFLRAWYTLDNDRVARLLGVGETTIQTYVSDVRNGRRGVEA